jgi:hypothetical protein
LLRMLRSGLGTDRPSALSPQLCQESEGHPTRRKVLRIPLRRPNLTQVGHRPANNGALRWPVTNIAALAVLAEIGLAALDAGRGTQMGSFRLWKAPRPYLQLDAQINRA